MVSGYLTFKVFHFRANTSYSWGIARRNHTFNDKLLSSVTRVGGSYNYDVEA